MIFLFQQIGVELGLLTAFRHIHAGAFRFDHRQRAAVVAVEHIVRVADVAFVRHAGQLHFVEPVLPLRPSGVGEHGVDVELTGLVFGKIERLRHIGRLLRGAASGELLLERGVLRHERCKVGLRTSGAGAAGASAGCVRRERSKWPSV